MSTRVEILMQCEDCGHVQTVRGVQVGDAVYFGSSYDFCDECDGLPVLVESDLLTNNQSFDTIDSSK